MSVQPQARDDTPPEADGTPYGFDDSLTAALAREWNAAPWYMTSLSVHSVLFLLLLLMPVEQTAPPPTGPLLIEWEPPKTEPPEPPKEFYREPVDNPIPVEDPTHELVPPVILENIELDTTFETPDDDPAREAHGDLESISTFEAASKGAPAIVGLGANGGSGGGNPFGRPGPGGQKLRIARIGQPPQKVITHINRALAWLAAHQEPDGHWNCKQYGGRPHDVAVTSLALLAFLANGNTVREGRYRRNVHKAVYWLTSQQQPNGRIGPHRYEAGIALMAMAEAYGMSGGGDLRRVAQKCVDYAAKAQCPAGAFDYAPASQRNDTSVFGWWVMGIKSAKVAKLHVPYEVIEKAIRYIQTATATKDTYGASVSYASKTATVDGVKRGGGSSRLTAVALTCLQFLGRPRADEQVVACAHQAVQDGVPTPERSDFYRWYYGSLGLLQFGIKTPQWRAYGDALYETLMATQVKAGTVQERKGSWNYETEHFGDRWGRVGQTALGALMLEVCFRYSNVHSRTARR